MHGVSLVPRPPSDFSEGGLGTRLGVGVASVSDMDCTLLVATCI